MTATTLSSDQKNALEALSKWYSSRGNKEYITLGGFAGTGKTTLISLFRKQLHDDPKTKKLKIAFCSYTGKATQNLKNKLDKHKVVHSQDKISTIHGLIYSPIENANLEIIGWEKKEALEADLIIVDEASMIDPIIWMDLLSYNIPIIAVGDHGQLPPINSDFNLMEKPDLTLTTIHRQAAENPIIEVSIYAREEGKVPIKSFGKNIVKYFLADSESANISSELLQNYSSDTLILCGYNSTRNKINQFIRNSLGFESPAPQSGDRVICLRNNHKRGIYNGMLGTISMIKKEDDNWLKAEINMDDSKKPYAGLLYAPQFGSPHPTNFTSNRKLAMKGDLFDFGYALTVHKAQGSQAKRVILFEERFKQMDDAMWKKWLYTGITRAEEELFLFGA